jgi:SagB-type dehydrogenase family enzyme
MSIKRRFLVLEGIAFLLVFIGSQGYAQTKGESIFLTEPRHFGDVSLEQAIYERKSIRSFKDSSLRFDQLSQLLWAASGKTIDGITGPSRSAPSAGGLYPLELFAVIGKVKGLKPGMYRYSWKDHSVRLEKEGDLRAELARAALNQLFIQDAPLIIVITAVYERTARKYGRRGTSRYVYMDAGHAAQNIFLQTVALGLGTVTVGAFMDHEVKKLLNVRDEDPILIMPIGWPSR